MSEELHPGLHPGADALSAFLEGGLAEHERAECLAHLADCAQCREVVFLARAAEVETPAAVRQAPVPIRRKLLRPIAVATAIAATIVVVFSVGLYRMIRSAEPRPTVTASAETASPAPVAKALPPETSPQTTSQAAPKTVRLAPRKTSPVTVGALTPPPPPTVLPSQPQVNTPAPVAAPAPPPPPPPAAQLAAAPQAAVTTGAGVAGTVTDPAGAVIPRAQVELKNDATGATYTAASDARGEFSIAGLTPGRYDLSVSSMGFQRFVKPSIEVQPETIARVDSTLNVGATTESVTVTAAAPLLQTESGQVSRRRNAPAAALPLNGRSFAAPLPLGPPYTLPDKSNPVSFAMKDKLVVAVDSAGSLFRSEDGGRNWKHIKGKWKGKVVRVETTANAKFELTTDPPSAWLSADGRKWTASPASH